MVGNFNGIGMVDLGMAFNQAGLASIDVYRNGTETRRRHQRRG
jgi:hypothetical protein